MKINRVFLLVILFFLFLLFALGGCSSSDSGDDGEIHPPQQLFAVASQNFLFIFGVGVDETYGYRLYRSNDGVVWAAEPQSPLIINNTPNYFPSSTFLFTIPKPSTDRYYMARSLYSGMESTNSPVVYAQVVSDFSTNSFSMQWPLDGLLAAIRNPDLSWDAVGSQTTYFVHIESVAPESWDYFVSTNTHKFGTTTNLICGKYGSLLPANTNLNMYVVAINNNGWGNHQSEIINFTTGTMVELLSTTFDDLNISDPNTITPFLTTDDVYDFWAVKHPDSFQYWSVTQNSWSGEYAVNMIPDGNPPIDSSIAATQVISSAIIDRVFDVTDYDYVKFQYYRYTTSNPRIESVHNCDSALEIYLRLDSGPWITLTHECGQHKTETLGWQLQQMPAIDVAGNSTIEFAFQYGLQNNLQADPTVFYLIDDFEIMAYW